MNYSGLELIAKAYRDNGDEWVASNAREDVPALVALVLRLRARVEELERAVADGRVTPPSAPDPAPGGPA